MKKYYVYIHKKADTQDIFYVGISGSIKYTRGYSSAQRNNLWNKIVKKHGYSVEIIADNLTKEDAINIECDYILKYGRISERNGCLCNITKGGEGATKSQKERDMLSKKMKGENNPNFGKPMSNEQKQKIKKTLLLKKIKRPMSNEHKIAISNATKGIIRCTRKVVNTETMEEFNSIKECMVHYKITYGVFYRIIKNGGGRLPLKYK